MLTHWYNIKDIPSDDSELKSLRDYCPTEFDRLPRGLNDVENYKGNYWNKKKVVVYRPNNI